MREQTWSRKLLYSIGDNSYGLPATLTYFLKSVGLTGVGDIPCSFVHFEQGLFCIAVYGLRLSNDMQIADH